jgi:hypothetical protein
MKGGSGGSLFMILLGIAAIVLIMSFVMSMPISCRALSVETFSTCNTCNSNAKAKGY